MSEPITVDRKAQRRLRQREKNEYRALRESARKVLLTPEGQRVLEFIVFTICERDGVDFKDDVRLQAFRDGMRNAGFKITAELRLMSPQQWLEVEIAHLRRIYAGRDAGEYAADAADAGDTAANGADAGDQDAGDGQD